MHIDVLQYGPVTHHIDVVKNVLKNIYGPVTDHIDVVKNVLFEKI